MLFRKTIVARPEPELKTLLPWLPSAFPKAWTRSRFRKRMQLGILDVKSPARVHWKHLPVEAKMTPCPLPEEGEEPGAHPGSCRYL